VLDKNPTEPAANLAAGRYECFVTGNWARGVPMLALGSDPKLRDVAIMDLRGATGAPSAEEQAAVGDAWGDLAESYQGWIVASGSRAASGRSAARGQAKITAPSSRWNWRTTRSMPPQ